MTEVTSFAELTGDARTRFLAFMAQATGSEAAEVESLYTDGAEFLADWKTFLQSGNPEAPEVKVGDSAAILDDFVTASIERASAHARKGAKGLTLANLGVVDELNKSIAHTMITVCRSQEDIDDWRDSTIGQFTRPVSLAMSDTLTVRTLRDYLEIGGMLSTLAPDVATLAGRVNWELLRILKRWVTYVPGDVEWAPGESYSEAWRVDDGCADRLAELVKSLASKPLSREKLRESMDAHDATLGKIKAEKAEKGRTQKIADMIGRLRKAQAALGLSKVDLMTLLIDDGLFSFQVIESAMQAIVARGGKKGAGPVTPHRDETGAPAVLTMPQGQTRTVHAKTGTEG